MNRSVRSSVLAVLVAVLGACASPRAAGPKAATPSPTAALAPDRAALVAELSRTRQEFLDSVAGLSEAQLRFKAAPDRWSVAEVAEHIAVTEGMILQNMTVNVMHTPMTAEMRAQIKLSDADITERWDRTTKRKTREALLPTGRWHTTEETVAAFSRSRADIMALANDPAADLRGHGREHPVLGMIDGQEWLVFVSAHCGRHTAQILEVKADPGFPKA